MGSVINISVHPHYKQRTDKRREMFDILVRDFVDASNIAPPKEWVLSRPLLDDDFSPDDWNEL